MVSNISISKMKLIINGNKKEAIQLATVGTLEEYRKKGLSRYLMEIVLAEYKNGYDLIFLGANETVLDFYPKFGFRQEYQYEFTANMPVIKSKKIARSMNVNSQTDLDTIKSIFKESIPISNCFFAVDYFSIFMFYVMNFYKECLWFIEEKGIIVVCEVIEQVLHIYDILSMKEFDFLDVVSYLPVGEASQIRFHFTPDLMGIDVRSVPILNDDPFFVQGNFGLEGKKFKFPKLAQT